MLEISSEFRRETSELLDDFRANHKDAPIMYEDFLHTLLTKKHEESHVTYPRTIKIAKPIKDLLNKDYEPAKIITIPAPITYKGLPIWEMSADSTLEMHFGYLNGDKRFLSDVKIDAKNKPHATLAGSTGSGKSVALNALIFSMLFLYAPWELNLHMSDSKIVEFRRYGLIHHIPHIKTIAATSDTGYIQSMLDTLYQDMIDLNTVLSNVGARNITDFKKKTGLTIPRNIYIGDEYQTTIMDAGRKAGEIVKLFDLTARLGRNTNYNMVLASQDLDPAVKPLLKNIPIRMCLKTDEGVSEMILGNTQGALGDTGVGKMYVNTEPNRKSEKDNMHFYVPYQTDENFEEEGKFLEQVGKDLGIVSNVHFYDEQEKLLDDELKTLISRRNTPNSLVLGVPSFIGEYTDRYQIDFDNKDIENMLVYTPTVRELNRFFKTIYYNALEDKKKGTMEHHFLVGDSGILEGISPGRDGFKNVYTIQDTESHIWTIYLENIYVRKLVLEADEFTFSNPVYDNETAIEFYKELFGDAKLNEVNKSRMFYFIYLLQQKNYQTSFGLDRIYDADEKGAKMVKIYKDAFDIIASAGDRFLDTKITKDDLSCKTIHVLGHHRINGLGRDTRNLSGVKKALMDACNANIKFIFYTINVSEIFEINEGFKYYILDNVEQTANKVKCEYYPPNKRPVCAVFFDRSINKVWTFKKLYQKGDKV